MRATSGGIRRAARSTPTPDRKASPQPSEATSKSEIARVADDTINAACDERMSGLDCNQPAKSGAEHEDRPDAHRATGGKQDHPEPTDSIAVDDPDPLPVRPCRQKSLEQPDQGENGDDPAVLAVLADSGTQVSAGKRRSGAQYGEDSRQRGQRRLRKESRDAASAENREPKIDPGPHDNHQHSGWQIRHRHRQIACLAATRLLDLAPSASLTPAAPSSRRCPRSLPGRRLSWPSPRPSNEAARCDG